MVNNWFNHLYLFVWFEEKVVWKVWKECESENAKKYLLVYYLDYKIICHCKNRKTNIKKHVQEKKSKKYTLFKNVNWFIYS